GQAGGGDLPRALDAGRGRGRARPQADLVAEPPDRHPQRGRELGGRAGRRRPGPRHEPQARRHPGVQREDGRGVRRGQARGAAREDAAVALNEAAILDVDGTLVDASYHHALAWYRAFREHDVVLPVWRLHRHVGMGGDKYVAAVAGEEVEERLGDELRDRWEELFDELIGEVAPFEGAHDLIADLKERGRTVVLASSSIERHLDHYLDLVDARELLDGWTTKDEVEATKPEPDLVRAALEKAGT